MSVHRGRDFDVMVQPVVRNVCRRLAAGDVSRVCAMSLNVMHGVGELTRMRLEVEVFVEEGDWTWTEAPPAPTATAPPSSTPDARPLRDLTGVHEEG